MTAGFLVTAETDPHEIAAASRCGDRTHRLRAIPPLGH